jgi:uncharacterized protein
MKTRLAGIAFAAAAILVIAGCSSQPSRFYSLNATAVPAALPAERITVLVGPVTIPSSVDRPQFVVQEASNRVQIDEFNRWDSPLSDSIARVVARDLAIQLGTPHVAVAPLANFKPSYRVSIDVQRFESIRGETAIIDAVWTVHGTAKGQTKSGRTMAREAVQGEGFAALAAAHSRALAKMSGAIAEVIRAEAVEQSAGSMGNVRANVSVVATPAAGGSRR